MDGKMLARLGAVVFIAIAVTATAIDMARIDALTATGYRIIGKNLIPYAPDFD